MKQKILAEATGDVVKIEDAGHMEEYLHFELQDKDHTFMIGLSTLLECLRFAEAQGEVPELPYMWWQSLMAMYPSLERLIIQM